MIYHFSLLVYIRVFLWGGRFCSRVVLVRLFFVSFSGWGCNLGGFVFPSLSFLFLNFYFILSFGIFGFNGVKTVFYVFSIIGMGWSFHLQLWFLFLGGLSRLLLHLFTTGIITYRNDSLLSETTGKYFSTVLGLSFFVFPTGVTVGGLLRTKQKT